MTRSILHTVEELYAYGFNDKEICEIERILFNQGKQKLFIVVEIIEQANKDYGKLSI